MRSSSNSRAAICGHKVHETKQKTADSAEKAVLGAHTCHIVWLKRPRQCPVWFPAAFNSEHHKATQILKQKPQTTSIANSTLVAALCCAETAPESIPRHNPSRTLHFTDLAGFLMLHSQSCTQGRVLLLRLSQTCGIFHSQHVQLGLVRCTRLSLHARAPTPSSYSAISAHLFSSAVQQTTPDQVTAAHLLPPGHIFKEGKKPNMFYSTLD